MRLKPNNTTYICPLLSAISSIIPKRESSASRFSFLRISPIVNRHSYVHCVRIVFGHPTFVHFPKLHSGSKRMSITPDFIRILFVECASRQARVSLSSFPRDLIPQTLLIFTKSNKFLSKYLHISEKSTTFALSFSLSNRR